MVFNKFKLIVINRILRTFLVLSINSKQVFLLYFHWPKLILNVEYITSKCRDIRFRPETKAPEKSCLKLLIIKNGRINEYQSEI